MTKRIMSILWVFMLATTVYSQNWEIAGVIPPGSAGTGWPQAYGQGLAVDGEGKIWYTSYYSSDSIGVDLDGDGNIDEMQSCRAIYVFNPDGSQAAFSPITTITVDGITDTLWNSNRGLRRDPDGNIVAGSWAVYYRINHTTGEGMQKLLPFPRDNPEDPWAGESITAAAFDDEGNLFTNMVVAGGNPIRAFDTDFEMIDDVVAGDYCTGYSRTLEVSGNANDIYFCSFTDGNGVIRFHSDDGLNGDYLIETDTVFAGMSVEAIGWQPGTGYLWAGNSGAEGWTNCGFYALDPATDEIVDSLFIPGVAELGGKPRGIDFSPDGNTAYVTFFNSWDTDAIYVLQNGPTNTVSFSVDMNIQVLLGRLNPSQDQVELRGSFNDWGNPSITLLDGNNNGIYRATVDFSAFEADSNHEYKFVIVKPDQDIWESRSNRGLTYNGVGMHLPTVWFNDVSDLEQSDPWSITLTVSGGGLVDLNNSFGTQVDATTGYDQDVDLPEPPLPPSDYLQLYFPHPEWGIPIGPNFTTDYRGTVDMFNNILSWDFDVVTDQAEITIDLDFSNALGLPYVMTYFLEDITHGVVYDLADSPHYSYNSGVGGVNQFRVNIGETLANQLDHVFDPGWHLFSLPLITAANSTDELLGPFSNQPFYVYDYESANGYAIAPELEQGHGYWLATMDMMNLQIEGLADTSSYSASLDLGWNLIGNPYSYDKPLAALRIELNGDIVDFTTAVGNGWVSNSLYGYGAGNYVQENNLSPWGGYWLSALVNNLILHLNFWEDETTVIASSAERSEEEWYLSISAQQNENADLITQIGVHSDASAGFDAYFDYPEPPQAPTSSQISTYFVHSNWNEVIGSRYNRDIRSPIYMDESEVWQLTIQSEPGEVALGWAYDTEELPEHIQLILTDINHGITINMIEQEDYLFNNASGESVFLITVLRSLVGVEGVLIPGEYALSQNFPNPFNPTTTISYALPEIADVKLTIYDIMGREVVSILNGQQPIGYHKVLWNGTNAAGTSVNTGVYFCRLKAGDYSKTIKMIFLK